MKKNILTIVLSLLCGLLSAQAVGTLKGKLIDSIGKQSLKDASVEILKAKDSSKSVIGLAKADGTFDVRNIPLGNYIVRISFQSYSNQFRNIKIVKANQEINLGNIYLSYTSDRLPDVVVTQSSVQIKKDTVEFSASNFTVKPNAVAEDLLKKIPGMDVDKSGAIKSQGETVQRVLVNGKRFFGDDPKMATKNLPPDVIDKIQVFDDLSDQSKFTGFDDGNRVKTINITTKKNTSKGYFGKAVAAAGTDGNYDESFNLHRFDGNTQISALGQANNINKQNFTPQDMSGGGGGRGGGGGGGSTGSGITTTLGAGLNMKTSWGKMNSSAYGSYFYNDLKGDVEQQSQTQTLVSTDSSTFKNSVSSSNSNTANHRVNFNLEENFDSSNSLVARPNIAFQTSTPNSSSSTSTAGTTGSKINNSVNTSSSYNSGYNINGSNIQLRHKFKKKFRTISLDLNFSNSANDGDGYSYAVNSFYGAHPSSAILNQYYVDSFHSFSFTPTVSYTEPIAKNQILEFRYSYNTNTNHSVNNTYEFNNVTGLYDKFDSLYSNSYKYNASSNTLSVSYRLQQTKYNFNIGTGVQYTDYKSENTVKNIIVAHNYINLTPTANFTYNFKKTENFRIFYSGRTGQPSVTNLQPLKTISGLDTSMGNPDLKPQFINSVRILYTSFDPVTQHIMFATLNASATSNDIQNSIIQHVNGTKTTTYTNLNGTYSVNGYFNYGFALKKPKSNLSFSTNIGYTQSQTLVSTDSTLLTPQHNFTKNTTLGETVKWTTNLKDNFDMNFSAGTNYVIANNSLNPTLNSNYFVHTLTTDFTFFTKSGWILASDITYTYIGNRPAGYNASVPLVNPSIAKQFLKNKAGELRLTVFDLFNQNVAVSRSVTSNTIVDSRTNVLKQYFMLTFTYNLRNFAGQQQKMPGMFRGMRPPGGFGGDGGHFDGGGGFGGGGGGGRRGGN